MKINYEIKSGQLEQAEYNNITYRVGDLVSYWNGALYTIEKITKQKTDKGFLEIDPQNQYSTSPTVHLKKQYSKNFKAYRSGQRNYTINLYQLIKPENILKVKERKMNQSITEHDTLKSIINTYENKL